MDTLEMRKIFYEQIKNQSLDLSQTLKAMRKIAKMTQPAFAEFVGVAPRIITDIERGVANPTVSTLKKIGKPFGLDIGFTKP